MFKITLLVLATLASGCYGSQMSQMDNRMVQMERENASLRRQNAQMRKQTSVRLKTPVATPVAVRAPMPVVRHSVVATAPVAPAARAWVRRSHGQYVCLVDYDAHISLASRVKIINKVDKSMPRKSSWISLTLNGQPVAIMRSTARGPGVQYHLAPFEECTLQISGADNYKVISALYSNEGTHERPVLLNTHMKSSWSWKTGTRNHDKRLIVRGYHFANR